MFGLSKNQVYLLNEFYSKPNTKVILSKQDIKQAWDSFRQNRQLPILVGQRSLPALFLEINRAISSGNNLQPAVFSECVFAQTMANMYNFSRFIDCRTTTLPVVVTNMINSEGMVPRYAFTDGGRYLIQAGGCSDVDGALIALNRNSVHKIEFKEAGAKTPEPDLPFYAEDGTIHDAEQFIRKNPQLEPMFSEQANLNFFTSRGHNQHNFSLKAINYAIDNAYQSTGKFADVVITVDKDDCLTMLPANKLSKWATRVEGEIRPSGRNNYAVFTPNKLSWFIGQLGGTITGNTVSVPVTSLEASSARGGASSSVNRYKIEKLFFVRAQDVRTSGNTAYFSFDKIRQLKPTITAKVFFDDLSIQQVRDKFQ